MCSSLPELGTIVLCAVLVAAAYTLAVSLVAGAGRPRLLRAARQGVYGTLGLVLLATLLLAHAFVTHDFRVRYVAHYSDRSMPTPLLVAALWGGQDGSLLWWVLLSALLAGACAWWIRGRYRELAPYVIATLMAVLLFFAIVMLFASNPFAVLPAGAPADGRGLNYQLRNFYMIVHPPALYLGFTGAAVPFAFAVAALVTGRLDSEWIVATRKWMLFSWLFLALGNALGMLWAYEELGWGGYWAWDPVENASLLPWLTASAYLHSVMVQERRGMLKTWNVFLICATFFLTIFGTFLTRSGMISSVHSFAESPVGIYFAYFMGVIVAVCAGLGAYRWRELRSEAALESVLSRETTFVANNWGLVSLTAFVAVATLWPRLSQWLLGRQAALGPAFYNAWVPPLGLFVLLLMGTAPLLGWRKSSRALLWRSFSWPVAVALASGAVHLAVGARLGLGPFVAVEPIYPGALGAGLAWVGGKLPLVTVTLVAYNLTVVIQEIWRGLRARRRTHGAQESRLSSLGRLIGKARRRYGGYLVHAGVAVMFLGFAGRAWGAQREASLQPGQSMTIGAYELKYAGSRTELDGEKLMLFADLEVQHSGRPAGRLSPARFEYKASPDEPSSEISRRVTAGHDLYVVLGALDRKTGTASFQAHLNPLVSFVWLGVAILLAGALVAMWPEPLGRRSGALDYFGSLRARAWES